MDWRDYNKHVTHLMSKWATSLTLASQQHSKSLTVDL